MSNHYAHVPNHNNEIMNHLNKRGMVTNIYLEMFRIRNVPPQSVENKKPLQHSCSRSNGQGAW